MPSAIIDTLSLVDTSGLLIIAAIVVCLAGAVIANFVIRSRHASIARDLWQNPDQHQPFASPVLEAIVREVRIAMLRTREVNTQAIIEHQFQTHLKPLLLGERFVRASSGLMIILGLVGTFYGLTLAIGKLVGLVSREASSVSDITQALTSGLTEALSGMSVAFSTSLFGIAGAIVMTLVGVAANVTDQRTALMVQIETYVDHVLRTEPRREPQAAGADMAEKLERILGGFSQSISALDAVVGRFDGSLQGFAANTRDFQEFNLHLKDNVQRMSLSFGDFSDQLRQQVRVLRSDSEEKG